MTSQELQYIISEKNKNRLLVDGFLYYKDFSYKEKNYWRCVEYQFLKCKARVHTIDGNITNTIGEHNHAGNAAKNISQGIIQTIREKALQTQNSPHQLITEIYKDVPTSVSVNLPRMSSMKRTVQRVRGLSKQYPNETPLTRQELNISDSYKTTSRGDDFLLFDSGKVEKRILIFSTRRNLIILSQHTNWYSDGTFKSCPNIFTQFYTIHVIINNKSIPLVFGLLPDKSQSTYIEFLQKLLELENGLKPKSILIDLEQAAINAYKIVFPDIIIRLCFFHFKQCLYRQVTNKGLKQNYDKDPNFAQKIRMLAALAYVKPEDVEESFILLSPEIPEIAEDLLEYFSRSFIGYTDIRGIKKPGQFPIEQWNIYNIGNNLPKTNNHIEGWHRGFNELVHIHHPSIWKFIDFLKSEQGKNEIILEQIISQLEEGSSSKRKYIDYWQRIKNIVENYTTIDRIEYLKGIANNI